MAKVFSVAEVEAKMLSETISKKKAGLQAMRREIFLRNFLKNKELQHEENLLKENESRLKELSALKTERTNFLADLQHSRTVTDLCGQFQYEKDATKEAVNKWNELHTEEKKLTEQKAQLQRQKEIALQKVLDLTNKMRQLTADELEADKETNGSTGSWPKSYPNWEKKL